MTGNWTRLTIGETRVKEEVLNYEDVLRWTVGGQVQKVPVINPYDGSEIDTVPRGDAGDVNDAVTSAKAGATAMAGLTAHERYTILRKVADMITERQDDFARTITLE